MQPLFIEKTVVNQIIKMFDICYKQGVIDAYEMDDRRACEEFLQDVSGPRNFGLLALRSDMSWKEWSIIVSRWALNNHLMKIMDKVFNVITTYQGFIAVVIPMTFDFYKKGIKDYIENPIADEMRRFKEARYAEWGNENSRKMVNIINDMQILMFDRERTDDVPNGGLTKVAYRTFSMIVSRSSTAYSRKRR